MARRHARRRAPKGPWWQRFGDARLDALQAQALAQSPTLALANARLAQARAVVAATSAGQWPAVNLERARRCASASRPTGRSATTPRRTSRRFRTTESCRSRSTTSSISPAASSGPSKALSQRRAGGRRLREHPPPARHRPRDRLLQPARHRHRARCAGALDRPAAPLARLRPLPARPRRRLGARRRPAAGAARHTLTQLDVLRRQRGAVRARGRDADGNAGAVVRPRARHPRADAAGGAARRPFRRPGAPARRRFGRARDGRRQRADRRRHGGVLPEHHAHPNLGYDSRTLAKLFSAPSRCGGRRAAHAAAVRSAGRLDANVDSRAPATTPPSPTTAASC